MLLTKGSVLLFSVVATVMACLRSNIYELVGESSVLSLVTLFAPLVFGLYWKKTSSIGAMVSMITGFITWVTFEGFVDSAVRSLVPATIVSVVSLILVSLAFPDKNPSPVAKPPQ